MIVFTLTHLLSICSVSLVASVILSMYVKTIKSCTRYPRKRVSVNMHGSGFTLARLKIVSNINNLIYRSLL